MHIGGGEVEYRLVGYKDEWSEILSGNYVTYTNISPGHYKFEIRLKNFPAVIRSLTITIVPPFMLLGGLTLSIFVRY